MARGHLRAVRDITEGWFNKNLSSGIVMLLVYRFIILYDDNKEKTYVNIWMNINIYRQYRHVTSDNLFF